MIDLIQGVAVGLTLLPMLDPVPVLEPVLLPVPDVPLAAVNWLRNCVTNCCMACWSQVPLVW